MTGRRAVRALVLAMFMITACGDDDAAQQTAQLADDGGAVADYPAAVPFDTATAYLVTATDSITLRVDIADSDDRRAYGLMDRDALDDDAGMIFLYDVQQPGSSGFWMYRTRIPLDIAFVDGAGRIVAIRHMEPCPSRERSRCEELARGYNPGEPYYGALEVNNGYFAEHGVVVGDRVVLPGRIGG
ncbi:hypothetical protein BH23GEM10_BH23GEM10_00640 [soil metagenome]